MTCAVEGCGEAASITLDLSPVKRISFCRWCLMAIGDQMEGWR